MFTQLRPLFAALLLVTSHGFAATIQDERGTFTLNSTPQRIVVLELSFADALAAVDISPVGIADDNDARRILPEVRAHLKPWQSVGTHAQPSLEAISALKPDLIIADSSRHAGIYNALRQITPVMLLKSRNETYSENLQSAATIGEVVDKKAQMQSRLAQHQQQMTQWASQLPKGTFVVFSTSREQQFNLHTEDTIPIPAACLKRWGLMYHLQWLARLCRRLSLSSFWPSIRPGSWLRIIAAKVS